MYLTKENPDIVCLNEIKQNEFSGNYNLNIKGYNTIFKVSVDKVGRGVAIIVKNTINFEQIIGLDIFEAEIIGIKISKGDQILNIFSYYNPPDKILNTDLLRHIEAMHGNYIVCGDLNAKSDIVLKAVNQGNQNGKILEEFVLSSNAIVLNNEQPTFHIKKRDYHEILDVVIASPQIAAMSKFGVFENSFLDSDHSPIEIIISMMVDKVIIEESTHTKLNFSRTDWENFKIELDKFKFKGDLEDDVTKINTHAQELSKHVKLSAEKSTPLLGAKKNRELPKYIIDSIKLKRY